MTTQKGKRRLNTRARILLVVLAVLVVLGVAFFFRLQPKHQVDSHVLPFSQSDSYAFSENGVAYVKEQALYFDDLSRGKANWRRDLQASGFRVSAGEHFIVVYSDHMAQALDYENNMLTSALKYNSKIMDVRCGENYFSILRQDTEGNFEISRITKNGEQLTPLTTDGYYVTDFGYYGNDQLWMMSMDQATNAPVTRINTFSDVDTKTGVMTIDDELVSEIFTSNQFLFAAGTSTLRAYTPTGKLEERSTIYGWQVLDYMPDKNANYFLLRSEASLHAPETTGQGRLLSLPTAGASVNIRYPADCVAAFLQNGKIIMLSKDTAYIFGLDGNMQDSFPLGVEIGAALKVSKTRIMLISTEAEPRCYWMILGV